MTPSLYAEVGSEADIERVCDNPIYGSEDTDDQAVYTTPGLGNKVHEPTADHEFENIIYGTEAETNMYSLISDPAITRHALYDTVTKEGQ